MKRIQTQFISFRTLSTVRLSWIIVLLLLTGVGCTHTINMKGFDQGPRVSGPFRNKKVAVVVLPGRIQDGHTTKTDVYKYEFTNVEAAVTEALKQKFQANAKQVDVVQSAKLDPQSDYDFFVYPEVSSRSVHDFWTMGCLVKYRLEIRDRTKTLLVNEAGEGKRNFFSASQADGKCKEAMSEVFIKTTDKALSLLR